MTATGMEPFYVVVSRVGWARWKWTGWDDGGIAVASGEALTEACADAAAREWVHTATKNASGL